MFMSALIFLNYQFNECNLLDLLEIKLVLLACNVNILYLGMLHTKFVRIIVTYDTNEDI